MPPVFTDDFTQTTIMPRAPDPTTRTARNAAICADRARGWPLRKIAQHHGISLALAYRLTTKVYIVLPGKWHRARYPKETPPPPQAATLHRLLAVAAGEVRLA